MEDVILKTSALFDDINFLKRLGREIRAIYFVVSGIFTNFATEFIIVSLTLILTFK